jgi:hypothetical protein
VLITEDQQPWCPEYDGEVRVSSLQTGLFAGPTGSSVGQHRFNPAAVVREAQRNVRLYTPQYGRIELRAKALDDPQAMVSFWLIGYEDEPVRSAEICFCEIFGRDVGPDRASIGMGVIPSATRRSSMSFPEKSFRSMPASSTSTPPTGLTNRLRSSSTRSSPRRSGSRRPTRRS